MESRKDITLQGFEAICCRQLSAEASPQWTGRALISVIVALDIDDSCPSCRDFLVRDEQQQIRQDNVPFIQTLLSLCLF